MFIIECWIEHPIRNLDQTFSYYYDEEISTGVRVMVEFNRQKVIGFTDSCTKTDLSMKEFEEKNGYRIKPILEVLDESSLITKELYDLAFWMREETLSTTISCFQAMLPAKVKPSMNQHQIVFEDFVKLSNEKVELTPKQLEAYQYVQEFQEMRYSDLRKKYPNQAKALVDKSALIRFSREKTAEIESVECIEKPLELTDYQKKAYREILDSEDSVFLLKGVTGSGKTEIYLQLAAHAIQKGKQVLILVPEIGLTPQMIHRVTKRFGNQLAIYHSGLNPQEKYEQYKMVKDQKAKVIVGTRSAVFLPFHDLGLIVMDEEHDDSYKQDVQPCYHCRDIALKRAEYHRCKIVLGSATPSLESYARAIKHVYHLVRLEKRIYANLPSVSVVPLKEAIKANESYIITRTLYDKMQNALAHNEQVILLLNRRGYHSMLRCNACKEPIKCPHCDLAMSYHASEKALKCHTCGTKMPVLEKCPNCGSKEGFSSYGFGTQRLEQEVRHYFPNARILRMDADTTGRKDAHEKILKSFGNHEADILLGTQMIAKGLDFPNVTLVGVINGDEGLSRLDFRSCEDTFDLLMQAAGRSGRADKKGEVIFQVFDPDHYAVVCAAKQDYDGFFQQEMKFRHLGMYPPYTYMISLTVSGKSEDDVLKSALMIKENLHGEYTTLGVVSLLKIKDRHRSRIILKGQNLDAMRNDVIKMLEHHPEIRNKSLRIDVNPTHLE